MTICLALVLLSLILIYLEFFLPGGVLGFLATVSIAAATVYAWPFSLVKGLFSGALVGILMLAVCRLALWQMKKSGKRNIFCMNSDQEGFRACSFDEHLIGKKGVCASDLKPSGYVKIDNKNFAAMSDRGYFCEGDNIIVSGGQNAYLIVKKEEK